MATSTNLFSYFPGLEVSQDELLFAEVFAQQLISAKFPDVDLREGTAIRDMVIRPSATLLALINKALVFYFNQNTISGVSNSTPTDFVDKILSNWFMTRKQGNRSVINARLYFAKSKSITLYSSNYFSTDGNLKFYPLQSVTYSNTQLIYEPLLNQYYLDIDLVAEKPSSSYDISTGSLLYFTNFDPYFLHAEINYLAEKSEDVESNLDFIARTKTAISTRNLINVPSIVSNLQNNFSNISNVVVQGFGDPLMVRDKKQIIPEGSSGLTNPIWVHLGGYTDVYCRTSLTSGSSQFTTDSTGKINISGAIYKLVRSTISAGTSIDTMPSNATYTVTSSSLTTATLGTGALTNSNGVTTIHLPNHGLETGERIKVAGANQTEFNITTAITAVDINTITYPATSNTATGTGTITVTYAARTSDYGLSNRHNFVVDFGSGQANQTVSFTMYYWENMDGIDNYLSDPENRVVCADLMARGMNITSLDVQIVTYDSVLPDATLCSTTVSDYLASLAPGQPFIMSDLLSKLYSAGIKTIKTPLTVTYTKYWKDMLGTSTGTITDTLNPNDIVNVFVLNSLQITAGTL